MKRLPDIILMILILLGIILSIVLTYYKINSIVESTTVSYYSLNILIALSPIIFVILFSGIWDYVAYKKNSRDD